MKVRRGAGLVQAAARHRDLTPRESERSGQLVEIFTKSLGGREALAEALSVADSSPEVETITSLLLDPTYGDKPLRWICDQVGLTIADLFTAYRKAILARAHVQAYPIIAAKLPEVVADVMKRAAPYEIPCATCRATGSIVREPTEKIPNPAPEPCPVCQGVGRLLVLPELDRQRLALELGQLSAKPGILMQQTLGVVATDRLGSSQAGALEQMQQAVGDLLFGRRSAIDADATEVDRPTATEPAAPPALEGGTHVDPAPHE